MQSRNFSFSPQGDRSSYIKNRMIDRTFVSRVSRAWNGLPGDVPVEPASVDLFKFRVNKLPLAATVLWYLGLAFGVCSVIPKKL
nr:unnamed protein product [Callosobruchus chinensis]